MDNFVSLSLIIVGTIALLLSIIYSLHEKRKSQRDSLTGLLNRSAGEPLIVSAMAQSNGCLAFIDLDNLKPINDQFGHIAGDHALVTVADVLRENSRNAIIARVGGDEFLFYMKNATEEEAQTTAERILRSFRSCKEKDPVLAKSSLSIGLCLSAPNDIYSDIYSKTDKALYYVKQNGKDGFNFYHRSVAADRIKDVDLHRLAEAIARQGNYEGSLVVEYRTFAKIYDFVNHLVDRYQHSLSLIMITLEPSSADAEISLEHHEEAMNAMEQAITGSLRTVDVNTRFSSRQFLVILLNAELSSIEMIVTRIFNQFYRSYTYNDITASYDVADIKGEN